MKILKKIFSGPVIPDKKTLGNVVSPMAPEQPKKRETPKVRMMLVPEKEADEIDYPSTTSICYGSTCFMDYFD